MSRNLIIEKLEDLIIQATTENSHFYVKRVCEEAKSTLESAQKEITNLQEAVKVLRDGHVSIVENEWRYGTALIDGEEKTPMRVCREALSKADAILGQGEK